MKTKPTVGQKLYSLNIGNAARNREQILTPVIVRKVGRKYFSASSEASPTLITEYTLEAWEEKTEYCRNSRLFENPQEWLDEKEATDITAAIRKAFDVYNRPAFDLETLRKIAAIINPNPPATAG